MTTSAAHLTVTEAAGRVGCPRSWLLRVIAERRVEARRDTPAMLRATDVPYLRALWAADARLVERRPR